MCQTAPPRPDSSPALEVKNLSYSYGAKPTLSNVRLTIREGDFKMLLGPNGAGKTTLLSLITRLFESAEGSIHVGGIDLNRQPGPALASMGVVFQQPTLDLDLTVRQNLLYHAALHGIRRGQAIERAEEELLRMNMAERRDDTVRSLNGGHRRRVEIARALLHRPKLLLLDEPTVGLDVPTRRGIVEHVHGLCETDGLAVMWTTHLIDELFDDDQVIIMHQGSILVDGGIDAVNAHAGGGNIAESFNLLTKAAGRDGEKP